MKILKQLSVKHQLIFIAIFLMTCGWHCKEQETKISSSPAIQIQERDGRIQVSNQDDVLLVYNADMQFAHDTLPDYYKRSGFIHPIQTLAGELITDGFPVGHTHQHGLFTAWTHSVFRGDTLDFWNQQKENAAVRHRRVVNINEEEQAFSVELEHIAYLNGDTVVVLTEQWDIITRLRDNYYTIDWASTQRSATQDSLHVGEYTYGGFAFRGAQEWNRLYDKNAAWLFGTDTTRDREEANHSRPQWASLYGDIKGSMAGVAIIPHSSNFRYPQFIRIHPTMPYYCFYPAVEERFSIVPGQAYNTKHRLVVFDGQLNAAVVEKEKELYLKGDSF